MALRMMPLLLLVAAGGAEAVEIEGEWELHQIAMAVDSRIAEESDTSDADIMIGETLAVALSEDGGRSTLVIDRSEKTLQMDGTTWDYSLHSGRLRIEDGGDVIEFIFTETGNAVMATVNISGQRSLNQVMIFEAIPGEDAAVLPSDSRNGTAKEAPGFTLEGSRFVNSSNDITMEFRSSRVKITIMGQTAGAFKYEREGSYVYVHDPNAGTVEYEIVDRNTISTDHYGLAGEYHRD